MYSLSSLLIVFVSAFAQAAEKCPTVKEINSRDIVGLEKYVQDTEFKSIECFISSLPTDIRAFRTYFKKSLSLQEASLKNPRALVGSPDGGFVLTFNGHKSQKGFNEVEFFALDKNTAPTRWIPGIAELKEGRIQIRKDVSKCTACHGNPARPIWGEYPTWPNSYGAIDDWLPDEKNPAKDSKFFEADTKAQFGADYPRLTEEKIKSAIAESKEFRNFRESGKDHPRYAALEMASDKSNPVYPYTEIYRTRNQAFRPNLIIGSVLARRQSQIMANRVAKDPLYKNFTSSFLHYDNCRASGVDHEQNKRFFPFIQAMYKHRFGRDISLIANGTNLLTPPSTYEQNLYSDYVIDLLGLRPHEKTLMFVNDTYFLSLNEANYFSGVYNLQSTAWALLLQKHILSSWSDKDSFVMSVPYKVDFKYNDLENFQGSYFKSEFFGKEMDQFLMDGHPEIIAASHQYANDEQKQAYAKMCEKLRLAAQEEVKKTSIDQFFGAAKPTHPGPHPEALNSCIKCHENSDKFTVYIPFSSQSKLAQFNKTYFSPLGYGNLLDTVNFYIDPKKTPAHLNGIRMPLGQAPLTSDEIKQVNQWIKNATEL